MSRSKILKVQSKEANSEAFADLFTADGAMLTPHNPAMVGKDNIKNAMATILPYRYVTEGNIQTIDLYLFDNIAYETGKYKFKFQDASVDSGKFVVVWKKVGKDNWKLYRDINVPKD